MNPYDIVDEFEKEIAKYAGSRYAVAVESGTAAIFLSLQYIKQTIGLEEVFIPKHTYPSVPASIIHAGGYVSFLKEEWEGVYQLKPYDIWDGALRFKSGMYKNGLHCLSFHIKKHLPIGRGGMILTDDKDAYNWLKMARFDGRSEIPLKDQKDLTVLGFNAYMTPEQAIRGLQLFEIIKDRDLPDMKVEEQDYPDLSQWSIYKRYLGYTNKIQGWMSDKDLYWLYQTAKRMNSVIEIGSWVGKSTHVLLSGCKGQVTAVDHFQGCGEKIEESLISKMTAEGTDIYKEFMKNVGMFKNLRVMKMDWHEAVKTKEKFDMIFIDNVHGDNVGEELKKEIKAWKPKINKVICGHEYHDSVVAEMVKELFGDKLKFVDNIWYVET